MDYAFQIRAASKPEAEEAIIDAMEEKVASPSIGNQRRTRSAPCWTSWKTTRHWT